MVPMRKRVYEPPRLIDVGGADERAYGVTGGCDRGNSNSSNGCGVGLKASPSTCAQGNSPAASCNHGSNVRAAYQNLRSRQQRPRR
jgi:hypothetical protein